MRPPAPEKLGLPLQIEVELGGELFLEIDETRRSAVLVDQTGTGRVKYRGLVAWDTTERELDARLRPRPGGFAIIVETVDAHYPITIDPLMCGVEPPLEGNQRDCHFGWSVSGAGDVNGDGYDDVIVGALNYDNDGDDETDPEGRVFVFHGSSSGVDETPDWEAAISQELARFGHSVSTAGDVNGDGYDDVIVGARNYHNYMTDGWGRAFAWYGGPSGLGPDGTASNADWQGDEGHTSEGPPGFGNAVSTAGDVNGDGYDDVIVGVPGYCMSGQWRGAAFVFYGSPTGLALPVPSWTALGEAPHHQFGNSVSDAGDVNGDGYDDVVIGCDNYHVLDYVPGKAYVYHGSNTGLGTSPAWAEEGPVSGADFGCSVSSAGSVNGDQYADIVIGAESYENGASYEGAAYVYHGSASGVMASAAWGVEGHQSGAYFGYSVSGAGDVNDDGYDDLIVGAPYHDGGQANEGRVYVYIGSSSGLDSSADWIEERDQSKSRFGGSVADAGDVNGDGFGDVVVGAWMFDNEGPDEGHAFVYVGHTGFPDCNENCVPDADDIAFGTSQDCNGDGIPDECQLAGNDCNGDGILDECQLSGNDCNSDGIPDDCQYDCNGNGVPDDCDIAGGATDADGNGVLDECEVGTPYCFGDGSGAYCPCYNFSSSTGRGCGNSTGDGALLFGTGSDSVSADDLVLNLFGMPPNMPCLYFQAVNPLNGIMFGDGFQCAGGQLRRLQVRWADSTGYAYSTWPIATLGLVMSGDTYRYQAWYRDPTGPCGYQFNSSNAISIIWSN